MSPNPSRRPRRPKGWPRRLARILLLVVAGLLALLAVLYLARATLVAPLVEARLAALARDRLGAAVQVERIGGDWVRELRLEGVQWHALEADAPLQFASVEEVVLTYSLRGALRGRADWLAKVEARGVRVRADFSNPTGETPREERTGTRLPETLPEIVATDVEGQVALPGERVLRARGGSARVAPGPGAQRIELALGQGSYAGPDLGTHAGAILAELSWDGRVLRLEEASVDGVRRLHEGVLDLERLHEGSLSFTLSALAFGGELRVRGELAPGVADLGLRMASLALGPALSFAFPGQTPDLRGELDLEGSLLLRDDVPATGRLRASARELAYGDLRAERLDLSGGFAGATFSVEELHASEGESRIDASSLVVPMGAGGVLEIVRASRGTLDLVLVDLPSLLPGGDGRAQRVPPHRLELRARLEGERATLERGSLSTGGGHVEVRSGRIEWGPTMEDLLRHAHVDVDLQMDFQDLSDLGPILKTEPWSGSLTGDLRLLGPVTLLVGALDVRGQELRIAGYEVGDVEALARVDEERVEVERLRARTPWGDLDLSGAWVFRLGAFEGVRAAAQSRELARILPEIFRSGEAELQASLDGPWSSPRGPFEISAGNLVLVARPQLELEVLEVRGELQGDAVRIDSLDLLAAGSRIHAAGELSAPGWLLPLRIRLADLRGEREGLDLALEQPVEVEVLRDGVRFEGLTLAGTAGRFVLSLRAREESFYALLEAPAVDPMPLLAPLLAEGFGVSGVSGRFELEHSHAQTRIASELQVERLSLGEGGDDYRLRARGTLQNDRAHVQELSLHSDDARAWIRGSFPLSPLRRPVLAEGEVDLVAEMEFPELAALPWRKMGFDFELSGALRGDLELTGIWDVLVGSMGFQARDLGVRRAEGEGGFFFGPAGIEGRAVLGDVLSLEGVQIRAPGAANIDVSGTWAISEHLREALEGNRDPILAAPLAAEARLRSEDLSFLGALAPALRRVGGEVQASLAVSGSAGAPVIEGVLELEQGELRAFADLPAVDALSARLTFDGRRMQIERLRGEIGAGPFAAEGEVALYPELVFDVRVMGAEVLLATSQTLRVRADADLHLSGPLEALGLEGRLLLREGRWTKNLDYFPKGGEAVPRAGPPFELFSIQDPPLSTMRLDIEIGYVRSFQIENNLARASVRPDLRLGGTGRAPELTGTLFLDEGRVTLPSSRLRLLSGTVGFTRAEPLVPRLDILLETRMRGYDVNVRLGGTPSEPELELSSVPPLSNEEIVVLLLSGQAPEGGLGPGVGAATAQDVALFVGRDIVGRWFGGPEGDGESFFERIEWQSGADISQRGIETHEVTIRLSEEERRLGRTVYLRGERDIYERINVGLRIVFRLE